MGIRVQKVLSPFQGYWVCHRFRPGADTPVCVLIALSGPGG